MRRAPHEGQNARRLQLKASSLSWPQSPQRSNGLLTLWRYAGLTSFFGGRTGAWLPMPGEIF